MDWSEIIKLDRVDLANVVPIDVSDSDDKTATNVSSSCANLTVWQFKLDEWPPASVAATDIFGRGQSHSVCGPELRYRLIIECSQLTDKYMASTTCIESRRV